jgi:hypothetical protein
MRSFPTLALATFALATGCGGAGAAGDQAGDEGNFTAGGSDGEGDGTTDDGGESLFDLGGQGTGTGDEGGVDPDACPLDCGGSPCVFVDDVHYCDCAQGTVWTPTSCEPCPVAAPADADIEVTVVTLGGRFLVGGKATPTSEYDDAVIWLENPHTGDRVELGNTHDSEYLVRLTPGVYDLVYEAQTPGTLMPANARALLGKVAVFEDGVKDVDVPMAIRGGELRLDGMPAPADEYDDARIFFRDPTTGTEVLAGNTHEQSYSVVLVAGTYEVVYRIETAGPKMPRNDGAILDVVDVFGTEDLLHVDVPSGPLSGQFLVEGEPPPASEYEDARIELASETGGTVALGNTHDQSYSIVVVPDTYEVVYRHESGTHLPLNRRAPLGDIDTGSVTQADIDVPRIHLDGSLTIGGGTPPASEFDDGVLWLSTSAGDEVALGNTHDLGYSVALVPGTYDVYYAQESGGGGVPQNKGARLQAGVAIPASTTLDLDVDAVAISGAFTISGAAPPASAYANGRVWLRDRDTGDAILLGLTHEQGYAALVVPGEYDLVYSEETGGDGVPANQSAALGTVVVAAPMSLDVEIPAVTISGVSTLHGDPTPDTPSDGGQLYLRTAAGDAVYLGTTWAGTHGANVVAGTYGVHYRASGSVTMPSNSNGRVGCLAVE